MRLVVGLVFAAGLYAQPAPLQFQDLAANDDGSQLFFSSGRKLFVFDGQNLRLLAQQDSAALGGISVSGDGKVIAYNARPDGGGSQANLATADGSVFWTTLGQAAVSRNGRFVLFLPGDGTVAITDLSDGSGVTMPAATPLRLTRGSRAVAADGTSVLRAPEGVAVVRGGSILQYPSGSPPDSAVIDDNAATVAYQAQDRILAIELETGNQANVPLGSGAHSLSGNGQAVLFLKPDGNGVDQAWIYLPDGTDPRELTTDANGIREAIISGDASTAYAVTSGMHLLRIDVAAGAVRDITADVTAAANPAPHVMSFATTPATILPGGAAQLCYQVANADAVSIQPGFSVLAATSGCLAVNPPATTTYTLTATGAGNQATATTTLTVAGNVQIASFSNDPAFSAAAGSAVTLRWTTLNAVSVVITGTGVPSGVLPLNGSVVVNPVTNTTYTLIAYGANGQAVSAPLYVFVR